MGEVGGAVAGGEGVMDRLPPGVLLPVVPVLVLQRVPAHVDAGGPVVALALHVLPALACLGDRHVVPLGVEDPFHVIVQAGELGKEGLDFSAVLVLETLYSHDKSQRDNIIDISDAHRTVSVIELLTYQLLQFYLVLSRF